MSTTMTALSSASIVQAEFIRLTTSTDSYYFCNAAAPITVNGMTFTNFGSLLSISQIDRNIKATSTDLAIQLTGVDGANVAIVLGANIKGSKIDIWRGFLDGNNAIITTPTQQFFKRYTGIVSNASISENFDDQLRVRIATVGITCASFRTILENRIQGIKTTPKAWNFIYPNDKSMDRVPVIASTYFDFGAAPQSGSQSDPGASTPLFVGKKSFDNGGGSGGSGGGP
jgi:3D (Asp-Asp-Asp) domain-containing protein